MTMEVKLIKCFNLLLKMYTIAVKEEICGDCMMIVLGLSLIEPMQLIVKLPLQAINWIEEISNQHCSLTATSLTLFHQMDILGKHQLPSQ